MKASSETPPPPWKGCDVGWEVDNVAGTHCEGLPACRGENVVGSSPPVSPGRVFVREGRIGTHGRAVRHRWRRHIRT